MKVSTAAVTTPGYPRYWRGFVVRGGVWLFFQLQRKDALSAKAEGRQIVKELLRLQKQTGTHAPEQIHVLRNCLQQHPSVTCGLIASIQGTNLHIAGIGTGIALLVREGKLGTLLAEEGLVSGTFRLGDVLLLTSGETVLSLAPEQWVTAAAAGSVHDIADALLQAFVPGTDHPSAALVITPASPWKVRARRAVQEVFRRRTSPSREVPQIYGQRFSRVQKLLLLLSVVFILVLTGSIFITVRHQQDVARQQLVEATVHELEQQVSQAAQLQDLNPVRSREILAQARRQTSKVLKTIPSNTPHRQTLQQWMENIQVQEDKTNHIFHLTSVPLFFDIGFIKPGGTATVMAGFEQQKVLLDTTNHVLYLLATDTKQASILAGPDMVKDAGSVTMHGNIVYLLTAEGIFAIDVRTKKGEVVIPREESWGDILSIATYGGNIYLLDRMHQTIWKYILTEEGYLPLDRYLPEETSVDPAPNARLTIDGSLWVNNHTDLVKFSTGFPQPFAPSDVPEPISTIDQMSTSELDAFIYLLDAAAQRIIVLGKDGVYQGQYRWEGLKHATDIMVSEDEQRIFVLTGSKIYAIGLQ